MLLLILCKHPNPTVCGFSESGKKMSSVVAVRGREQLNEMLGFCNIEQDWATLGPIYQFELFYS